MPELDRLRIHELRVRSRVGVTTQERRLPQEVIISVTLHADLAKSCRSDRLEDTVDYKAVKKAILAECESRSFKLIECMAGTIARLALVDVRVRRVDVAIQKPGALRFARCSEVEISRDQPRPLKPRRGGRR